MVEPPFYRDEGRPQLQRDDSMSLDTIHPKDIPRGKVMFVKDHDSSLTTQDISKARPTYDYLNYLDKPDLSVGCTDPGHAGGKARSYYAPMDRRPRDLSLTTADIELAQPRGVRHKGNRHTDPVCPNYELPSSFMRPQTPPRWNGRVTNYCADIEKSCPRVLHPDRNYIRDPNECRDIEYTTSNYKEKMLAQNSRGRLDRSLNVQDISGTKKMRPRNTNPLDPVYAVPTSSTTSLHAKYHEEHGLKVNMPNLEAQTVGHVEGSKPKQLTRDNGEPFFSLAREDIAGTIPQRWVGAVPTNIYDPPETRPMMSFHDPHDIPGAQVGTLRKGIQTGRCLNPLNPRYPLLDGPHQSHLQPVPTFEANQHPLVRSRAHASSASAPQLHSGSRGGSRLATPQMSPSQYYGVPQGQQMDQLEQLQAHQQAASQQGSRMPSSHGRMTPQQHQGVHFNPHLSNPIGDTIRISPAGSEYGQMSRRSMASSHGSLPGHPRY
eukprot:TRINITY_DN4107_c6_g1_i1.p1 TRINITY_DN4107_c6_g1~~TRINITY_DN4107_c6_g1_i1.p1  ORF type:complete len:490 (-),score=57.42 TRINITY_DN4107_c6_g1_i1:308-1777(-)